MFKIPAGNAVLAATEVEKVESLLIGVNLECVKRLWTFKVKEFGHIVSIDADGNNYFEEKKIEYNEKKIVLEEIYKHVGFIK